MSSAAPASVSASSSPRRHWLTGHFKAFRANPLAFVTACAREHGDAVPLSFVGRKVLLLSDPARINEVLLAKHRSFRKHLALRQLARPALGDGLLLSEGDAWQRQRQFTQPAFRGERITGYARVMVEHATTMCARWQPGQTLDIHAEMMLLTSRIVTRCLFGSELTGDPDEICRAMDQLSESFKTRMDSAIRLPLYIPTPANRRFLRGMTGIDAVLTRIIDERRRGPHQDDLLGALLAAVDDEKRPVFTDTQLRDQVATLFFAGHETTANTLTWTLWLLSTHPEVRARLEAEVTAVLAGRDPNPEDCPRLRYCGHVIDEAMRLMPPVWIIGREAIETVDIGGAPVAKGTTVLMSQWVVHRDPRWFPSPDTFQPERWQDGLAQRLPAGAYFPFGGGPRICIGNHFARMEMLLLLSLMVSRFRLTLAPGAEVVPYPSLTLRPQKGLLMTLAARS